MSIVAAARAFAVERHDAIGHKRKYTGDPYWVHLDGVVAIVRTVPHTPIMLCAGYLHDTVEDTGTTLDEIREHFGAEVADLVEMLTDVSRPEDGLRHHRKAKDRAHTAQASPQGKTLKLGDMIENTSSIVQHDRNFAAVYLPEKALLLDVLREGDPTLWLRARAILEDSTKRLGLTLDIPVF